MRTGSTSLRAAAAWLAIAVAPATAVDRAPRAADVP
jgi:hypothetical protein